MAAKSKNRGRSRTERRLEKIRERAQSDAVKPVPVDPADEAQANAHYPCPADGKTLFGWTSSKAWDRGEVTLLDHCEECGLVVSRAATPPDVALEITQLERDGDELVVPNKGSWAAWLGAAGWADLDADEHRLHLTDKAIRLLLAERGSEVLAINTPFSWRGYRSMLQTMINAFTLRHNFARSFRAGRLHAENTTDRFAFALDAIVTVLVAIPLSVVALLVEGLAAATNHGALMRVRTAPSTSGE